MRRFISTESSFASFNYDISNEEAEVMESEAMDLSSEIVEEQADAERMLDVADSLEDVAVVTDQITEATPAETQLVQVVGDMAVAGDGEVTAADIVPSTESYVGRRISSEGFVEKVKEIWANIKRWLKEIWVKVEKFFYKIFGAIPRLRKAIKALEERVEKVNSDGLVAKGEDNKFELTSGISLISVNVTPQKNGSDIKKAFEQSIEVAKGVLKSKELKDLGEEISKQIDDFDIDGTGNSSPEAQLNKACGTIYTKLNDLWATGLTRATGSSTRFKEYDVDYNAKILGGGVFLGRMRTSKNNNNALALAEELRTTRFEYTYLTDSDMKKKLPDSVQFTTLSTSDCDDLLKLCEEMLDELETFNRGQGKKELTRLKNQIEKSSDSLEKQTKNVPNEDKATSEWLPYTRAMFKFNMLFTNLASTATMQTHTRGLQNVRTVMMLVSRSLSKYRKP